MKINQNPISGPHHRPRTAIVLLLLLTIPGVSPKTSGGQELEPIPEGIIRDRQAQLAQGPLIDNARPPENDQQLRYWLDIMRAHRYSLAEMHAATGLDSDQLREASRRLNIDLSGRPPDRAPSASPPPDPEADSDPMARPLQVLPYPGGRHPRIGFRDGAIRPQRETKLSIFTPWSDEGGYVVADFPEAIWWQPETERELLYLAHTHVPTTWDRRGVTLPPLEWKAIENGWTVERTLPNQVTFGTQATSGPDHVRFEMWIQNGSPETVRGLLVQNCVMLAAAPGFRAQSNDNKVIRHPFVAAHDDTETRWIITAWEACARPWANPPCPCMHSDPQFPDCPPGETRLLRGWVSFYEGKDIQAELDRLAQLDWWRDESQLDLNAPRDSATP